MPQFDPSTFASQVFWLVVLFAVFYFLMARVALPRISGVLEERQNKIEDDLLRAEKLRKEAEEVLNEYESALSNARGKAREIIAEASRQASEEAGKRQEVFAGELAERTRKAEAAISEAKKDALANLRELAEEVAGLATGKLLGEKPSPEKITEAVANAMGGKA